MNNEETYIGQVRLPDVFNHPHLGSSTLDIELGHIFILSGISFPNDGDAGPYSEVFHDCGSYSGCNPSYREQIVINGIGGIISAYMSQNGFENSLSDPLGWSEGHTYAAVIRYVLGDLVLYDRVTFTVTPKFTALGFSDSEFELSGWGHKTVHSYELPASGGGGGDGIGN